MKLTNKFDLPKSLEKACAAFTRKERQPKRRISVTQLIGPARIRHLQREHFDELEEDVSDRIWALFGSAVHTVLHEGHHLDDLSEEKLEWQFDGWTISGIPDLLEDGGVLADWKVTSTYALTKGAKAEWVCQLNVYAEMYRRYGFDVTGARIVAILRDWSAARAEREPDYPQQKVVSIPVPLWSTKQVEDYVRFRLVGHRLFEDGHGSIDCTADERWASPAQYAVVAPGRKRALRVLNTHAEAATYILNMDEKKRPVGVTIEHRPFASRRCMDFCNVARWCPQWAQELQMHEPVPPEAQADDQPST